MKKRFLPESAIILFLIALPCGQSFGQQDQAGQSGILWDKVRYKAAGARDPFVSESEKKDDVEVLNNETKPKPELPPLPELEVQGMVWGKKGQHAIINNHVYRAGDTIEGATITGISADGVSILYDNKTQNLSPKVYQGESANASSANNAAPLTQNNAVPPAVTDNNSRR